MAGFADELILRTVERGGAHLTTINPANLNNGMDTAKRVILKPATGKTDDDYIIIDLITVQGVAPSNMIITVYDLNREMRILLNADGEYDGVLVGSKSSGIAVDLRNLAAGVATVVFQFATLNLDEYLRAVSAVRR